MKRYFKNNESYFKWLGSCKSKYNIVNVNLKDIKVEKNKKEARVIVDFTMRVREDKNMDFIKIYMMLDNQTKRLVDKMRRIPFRERRANLKIIRENMERLKIRPNYIEEFIQTIRLTLDIR